MTRVAWVLVLAALHACSTSEVQVSDTTWECERATCHVSFTLENRRDRAVDASYAVRALRRVRIRGARGSVELQLVGEVQDSVYLEASETRTLRLDLDVSRRPSVVVVTGWMSP